MIRPAHDWFSPDSPAAPHDEWPVPDTGKPSSHRAKNSSNPKPTRRGSRSSAS